MENNLPTDNLKGLKANDEQALKAIFQEHHHSLYIIIRRIVKEAATTEDLVQEVFVKLWEKRQKIELQGSLGPYLRRMAVNEALGYLRKQKKYQSEDIEDQYDLASEHADAATIYEGEELKKAIIKAIDQLPPKCRTVFMLSRFEAMSYKEIAATMNISVKTVENQIGKALKIMRKQLKQYLTSIVILLFTLLG